MSERMVLNQDTCSLGGTQRAFRGYVIYSSVSQSGDCSPHGIMGQVWGVWKCKAGKKGRGADP